MHRFGLHFGMCAPRLRFERRHWRATTPASGTRRDKPGGETPRYFREFLALTNDRINGLLQALVEDGLIKQTPVLKRKRWEYGYKLVGGETFPAGNEK
jgi:hypothetical protein